jgi:two-component system chemotaxis response regulator CheY
MKILIVDDAGVMRKVITRELIDMGIQQLEIVEACDGQQGYDMAVSMELDLILMDWNMPEMLGIDAVAEIRAAGIKTPIIMVTTEAERSNIIRAIQAGANNYLTKPFSKQDFQAKIQQTIVTIACTASTK